MKAAVEMAVQSRLGLVEVPFSVKVHQEENNDFTVETDLCHLLNIDEITAHKLVEEGLIGIAGLSQCIVEMKAYSAISGFREKELPLFRRKLDFIADAVSSQECEKSFRRVINLAGLPSIPMNEGAISVDKLLKVRNCSEAREFRDWLGGIAQASDDDIRDRITSFRAMAGLEVGGTVGKVMRFLVTNGLGIMPGGTVPALVLSVVDQFIVDRFLPRSGIAAFVNELYLSIFARIK